MGEQSRQGTMLKLLSFFTLLSFCSINCVGANIRLTPLENFIQDLVRTWKLLSPTIIFNGELPLLCWDYDWVLCLKKDGSTKELAETLTTIHRNRKQDGIIFVGTHKDLLIQLTQLAPTFFQTDLLAFMPLNAQNLIKLRLDTNIIFYDKVSHTEYRLEDSFAVKGGPAITLNLGIWNKDNGIKFHRSISRWGRRTDLEGTVFVNALFEMGNWASLVKDANGKIIGSTGFQQEPLFYIANGVNLTIKIEEHQRSEIGGKLLENGTWTGNLGRIQRGEIDVNAIGYGLNFQRATQLDFPVQTIRQGTMLIAGRPEGSAPNMWVYVRVFGILQWVFFLTLFVIMALGLTLIALWLERRAAAH